MIYLLTFGLLVCEFLLGACLGVFLALSLGGVFGVITNKPMLVFKLRTRSALQEKRNTLMNLLREGVMGYPEASDEYENFAGANVILDQTWIHEFADAAEEGIPKLVNARMEVERDSRRFE